MTDVDAARRRVAAYRAWLESEPDATDIEARDGWLEREPARPTLDDCAVLPWPVSEVVARQLLGHDLANTSASDLPQPLPDPFGG